MADEEFHLYRIVPTGDGLGRVCLDFHDAQLKAWDSDRRFVFFVAGTQSGKTSFGPWWLYREIQRNGAGDYLAVSATYGHFKLKMLPEMRAVYERVLGVGRYWSSDRVLELADPETGEFWAKRADDPMWGRIILRSADAEGGLESATAKAAWLDECGMDHFTVDAWDAVRRRLSLSRGRVLGTTTPYNLGWLKVEVMDRWMAGDDRFAVIQAESRVNPAFSDEEFAEAEATMPTWKFNMFYRGIMGRPPGLVYGDYHDWPRTEVRDEGLGHLVPDFAIPPEWPRYVGVDFGAVNQATLWVAEDPKTHVCYAYRETWEGNLTTREHCERFLDAAAGTNFQMAFGGAPSEQQQRWDWGAHGVAVQRPRVADVEIGIDRVTELFKARRLFVFESLRQTRAMLGSYSRVVDDNGQVTEKLKDKEKFHLLDCARYVAGWLVHLAPVAEEAA